MQDFFFNYANNYVHLKKYINRVPIMIKYIKIYTDLGNEYIYDT